LGETIAMQIEWGSVSRNCEGVSRRSFLKVGTLAALGLSLPELVRAREAGAAEGKRPANMIFVWLDGGPSHLETFDLKPEAPAEVRGEFKPIKTNVPGIEICELLPKTAQVMNLFTILRSISHNDSNHGAGNHLMTTGQSTPVPVGCGNSVSYHPSMGSFAAHERVAPHGLPSYINLGRPMRSGGPNFLGAAYGPLGVTGDPNRDDFQVKDVSLPKGVDAARLDARRGLLKQLDRLQRAANAPNDPVRGMDSYTQKAYDLVTSPQAKAAFDVRQEEAKLREAYGRSSVGQQFLLARRLVEAGVPWVSVHWGGWDHHFNIFNDMKRMLPTLDAAFSTLLRDLNDRGLLESTLVVLLGEFGRTPKINTGPGRDHWGPGMSVAIAGAGVPGGQVVGSTTPDGGYADERRLTPQDLACTIFQKLGIDYRKEFLNELGRPIPMVRGGEPIRELS
jgi:Protein of unknown function (DUF1501)